MLIRNNGGNAQLLEWGFQTEDDVAKAEVRVASEEGPRASKWAEE